MDDQKVLNFFYEMGQLRRVKREGWRLLGIECPESIAEHSLRVAQIAWVLAKMEGIDNPHEVVTMAVFHDAGEARIGDLHKLASRYGELNEELAVKEQFQQLGEHGTELYRLWETVEQRSAPSGIIAKDADLLELALRAKEYMEQGFHGAQEWLATASALMKTATGKRLVAMIPSTSSSDWWHGLKKI